MLVIDRSAAYVLTMEFDPSRPARSCGGRWRGFQTSQA